MSRRIVLVCGGRNFDDGAAVAAAMKKTNPVFIIQGGANGADRIASMWADTQFIEQLTIEADWRTHGKAAGPIRNGQMLRIGQAIAEVMGWSFGVVAFPGGRGTANMMKQAREAGVPVWEPCK